jgi:signal peptidase I
MATAPADDTARDLKKSTTREYYEALLIAIIFVNFARVFAFQAFKIPSGSMEDNLKVGDHVIVNKFVFGANPPEVLGKLFPMRAIRRGDVIVFRYPENPETDYVKRVVALPGETISIKGKRVYIDGKPLDEPYVIHEDQDTIPDQRSAAFLPEPWRSRDHFGPFTIPEGQYFAMGDNRDHSYDSRYWGPVARSLIKGRAFMVYWSFEPVERPVSGAGQTRERLRELASVARHFFTRTRWERSFFIIDSKHHYTPGVTRYGSEY